MTPGIRRRDVEGTGVFVQFFARMSFFVLKLLSGLGIHGKKSVNLSCEAFCYDDLHLPVGMPCA